MGQYNAYCIKPILFYLLLNFIISQTSLSSSIFFAETSLTVPSYPTVSMMLSFLEYFHPSLRTPDPWMVILMRVFDIISILI